MIDAMYNYRQGEIHSAEFSDEWNIASILVELFNLTLLILLRST